jgi:hypothetical protein
LFSPLRPNKHSSPPSCNALPALFYNLLYRNFSNRLFSFLAPAILLILYNGGVERVRKHNKRIFVNKKILGLGLGIVAAIAPMTLLGCGGGGGNGLTTPTTPAPQNVSAPVTFESGQTATLNLSVQGTTVTGTLVVNPVATTAQAPRAITTILTTGSYSIVGTFTPPRSYTVSGSIPPAGPFTVTGLIPTATEAGSYTVTVGGETTTGVIPATGTPGTPTATPTATPTTPPAGGVGAIANLTVSNVSSGSNFPSGPITSFNGVSTGTLTTVTLGAGSSAAQSQNLSFTGRDGSTTGTGERQLVVALTASDLSNLMNPVIRKFFVGQQLRAGTFSNRINFGLSRVQGTSFSFGFWDADATGLVTVTAVGTDSITLSFENLKFNPTPVNGGTGTFNLSGTLQLTDLAVVNN